MHILAASSMIWRIEDLVVPVMDAWAIAIKFNSSSLAIATG